MTSDNKRAVLVCTEHRGVFFGYLGLHYKPGQDVLHLTGARMAIYWGTTKGVMELCETGPTSKSRISARADLELRKITAVMDVLPAAVSKWESA